MQVCTIRCCSDYNKQFEHQKQVVYLSMMFWNMKLIFIIQKNCFLAFKETDYVLATKVTY
jgi:hypothetical protein